MQKGDVVIYVKPITTVELHPEAENPNDRKVYGMAVEEHHALVTAMNGLNEGHISLAYVDPNGEERDNVVRVFDIPHESHPSKDEINPDLPRVAVNCWRRLDQESSNSPAVIETKHYEDGVSATGVAPLPDHSPDGAPEVVPPPA